LIYLDSCLVIYLVEQHPLWGDVVGDAVARKTPLGIAISPLVKCECLAGPIRRGNLELQGIFGTAFGEFVTLDIPEAVYLRAAELRGRFGLKIPDALHLACAQHHGCDELWTNDDRLSRVSRGMTRNILASDPA
jgi:hypothetical protein